MRPEAGHDEIVLHEDVIHPVQATPLDGRGAIAHANSYQGHGSRPKRVQEGTPPTDDPRNGLLDVIEVRPEPELAQALIAPGGIGASSLLGGRKEGQLDQVRGQEPLLIYRMEDLLVSWSDDDRQSLSQFLFAGETTDHVSAKG